MIHTDVESFSLLDVRVVGAWRYWEDPSTEVLCLSWAEDDGPVTTWRRGQPVPPRLAERIRSGALCGAHNAQFERLAFIKDLGPRCGFPVPKLEQWRCTAAQAAALALPRALDKALTAAGLLVRKDPRGKQLIKRFCVPRKPTRADKATRIHTWEDPEGFDALCEYCEQDVRGERALYHHLPKLQPAEEKVWQLDTIINERGLPIDLDLVDQMIDVADTRQEQISKRVLELTGNIRATQRDKILEWLHAEGGEVQTLQAKELKDALVDDGTMMPAKVRELIALRLEASKVSTKKLVTVKKCLSTDGRVRGTLLYHGATPGRWAGKLIQPHNFPRGTYSKSDQAFIVDRLLANDLESIELLYSESVVEALSYVLRGIIKAPEGRVLNVADYAAIEARGLVWAARQEDSVQQYWKGADKYRIMAGHIFGISPDKVTSAQRKVGKDVILGCGYGMGVDKFMITCEARGAPVPKALATKGVYGYRDTHPRVVQFWKDCENAAVAAIQSPGKKYRVGYVLFYVHDDFLFIQLPSGRRLAYPEPRLEITNKFGDMRFEITFAGEGKNKHWMRVSTYGGKLVENIIQAIARDIMVSGMFNVEAAGYEVVSTVHDEIISEADAGFGSVKEYEHLLCETPEWGHTCPVAAEGYVAQRWRK